MLQMGAFRHAHMELVNVPEIQREIIGLFRQPQKFLVSTLKDLSLSLLPLKPI